MLIITLHNFVQKTCDSSIVHAFSSASITDWNATKGWAPETNLPFMKKLGVPRPGTPACWAALLPSEKSLDILLAYLSPSRQALNFTVSNPSSCAYCLKNGMACATGRYFPLSCS